MMSLFVALRKYLVNLSTRKIILWCYLIWYVVIVLRYFDPAPGLWLNSLGISAIVGFALMLGVGAARSGPRDPWQTFRLFLTPFCVSSFSSLIKGCGFFLIIPPSAVDLALSVGSCAAFVLVVVAFKCFATDRRVQPVN